MVGNIFSQAESPQKLGVRKHMVKLDPSMFILCTYCVYMVQSLLLSRLLRCSLWSFFRANYSLISITCSLKFHPDTSIRFFTPASFSPRSTTTVLLSPGKIVR